MEEAATAFLSNVCKDLLPSPLTAAIMHGADDTINLQEEEARKEIAGAGDSTDAGLAASCVTEQRSDDRKLGKALTDGANSDANQAASETSSQATRSFALERFVKDDGPWHQPMDTASSVNGSKTPASTTEKKKESPISAGQGSARSSNGVAEANANGNLMKDQMVGAEDGKRHNMNGLAHLS
ncbi:hypothetical protein AAL_07159 [Moelleriella libera RCEF 2490]|uniref:Uncharacterized protein n=1 Tax=Moelleriella libera RCEF 2490 TaxID=1081109 RepID=A0A162I9R1_9HYPO|nr:hypothetical protein AAL_07159 [Moelleriella libera RCEF 2490]